MRYYRMFRKHKIIPKPSFQVLLNNRLEKEIKDMAHSLNSALNLFTFSQFSIQDNHIYPNKNKYQLFVSFCLVVFFISLRFYRVFTVITTTDLGNTDAFVLFFLLICFSIVHVSSFTMMFVQSAVHKYNNVSLILKIQSIHKGIDFSASLRSYVTWNWITMLITIFINISIIAIFLKFAYYTYSIMLIFDCFCYFAFTAFDVSLMVAIRIIILLQKYLEEWIKYVLKMNEEQGHDEQCLKLLRIYKDVLITFKLYKIIFQMLTLCHVLDAFSRTLYFLETTLFMLKQTGKFETIYSIMTLAVLSWPVKTIIIVTIHSIYCEKFYITVEETETACIQLMKNSNCPKNQVNFYKTVILENSSFSKLSACGLFVVDATLPIRLMEIITYYVLVLLQFNFL